MESFMSNKTPNIYKERLVKLTGRRLLLFFAITLLFFVSEITIIYIKYIPAVLLPIQEVLPTIAVDHIWMAFHKLILGLSIWAFFFFVMCISMMYTFGNIKNLLQTIDKRDLNRDTVGE